MTQQRSELLEQAIAELSSLPLEEQDRFAAEILAELASEAEWIVYLRRMLPRAGLPRRRKRCAERKRKASSSRSTAIWIRRDPVEGYGRVLDVIPRLARRYAESGEARLPALA